MGEVLENEVMEQNVECGQMCCTGLEAFSDNEFYLKDDGEVTIRGTDEQVAEMFADYAKYFSEVSNPWNTMTNAFLKNKYAPLHEILNTVRPVLAENGFSIIQTPKIDEKGDVMVQTLLLHKSGAMMAFPSLKSKAVKADIQGIGAAITYLRRFSVSAVLGISSENDDDGESNSSKGKKPAAKKETLTPEQAKAKKDLIQLCADFTAKDSKNRNLLIEALKELEPTGNINKLKTDAEFNKATEIVKGLGL